MIKIAKAISSSGYCSRRQAERLIDEGLVKVNGHTLTSPAVTISMQDIVVINNKKINIAAQEKALWIYYKPRGYVTTSHDEKGRATIFDNLKNNKLLPKTHMMTIGRLDMDSEGLLLLTNNGAFARFMELPSSKIERTYKVRAYGHIEKILKFDQNDLLIDEVLYKAPKIKLITKKQITKNNWFEVTLIEGKNREIRNIFKYFKLEVNRLIRISHGPYFLGELMPGEVKQTKIIE